MRLSTIGVGLLLLLIGFWTGPATAQTALKGTITEIASVQKTGPNPGKKAVFNKPIGIRDGGLFIAGKRIGDITLEGKAKGKLVINIPEHQGEIELVRISKDSAVGIYRKRDGTEWVTRIKYKGK